MANFRNPHISNAKRNLWHALLWKFGYYDDPEERLAPPSNFEYPAPLPKKKEGLPKARWIGHSTFLIEVGGLTLLTDPVWDLYCSPVPLPLLRRRAHPPLPLEELPKIDLVLLSHNHYDHLDAKTVKLLHTYQPHIQWIVPSHLSPWFRRRGIEKVHELQWWEEASFQGMNICAVPAQHFSGRGLFDHNRTGWNGYVAEIGKKRFYFVGDTGYNTHDFQAIGNRWPSMDLSLIPIGAYLPRKFMEPVHISPKEAVKIHREVKSRLSLAMHWKTFRLAEEHPHLPPYDLYLSMKQEGLPFKTFLPLPIGGEVNW